MATLSIKVQPSNVHANGLTMGSRGDDLKCICRLGGYVGWDAIIKYQLMELSDEQLRLASSRRLVVVAAHRRFTESAGPNNDWDVQESKSYVETFMVGSSGAVEKDPLHAVKEFSPWKVCQLRSMHSVRAVLCIAKESIPGEKKKYMNSLTEYSDDGEAEAMNVVEAVGEDHVFPDIDLEWAESGAVYAGPVSIAPHPTHCDGSWKYFLEQEPSQNYVPRKKATITEDQILEHFPGWREPVTVYPGDLFALFPWLPKSSNHRVPRGLAPVGSSAGIPSVLDGGGRGVRTAKGESVIAPEVSGPSDLGGAPNQIDNRYIQKPGARFKTGEQSKGAGGES